MADEKEPYWVSQSCQCQTSLDIGRFLHLDSYKEELRYRANNMRAGPIGFNGHQRVVEALASARLVDLRYSVDRNSRASVIDGRDGGCTQ